MKKPGIFHGQIKINDTSQPVLGHNFHHQAHAILYPISRE